MSANLNQVTLIGRLGRDPEQRYTASGKTYASASLATSQSWKGADGEWQEKTDWHYLIAWGKTGEVLAQYGKKGDIIGVLGRVEYTEYEDKQSGQKKRNAQINVQRVLLFGNGKGKRSTEPAGEEHGGGEGGGDGDSVPF